MPLREVLSSGKHKEQKPTKSVKAGSFVLEKNVGTLCIKTRNIH